jgi:hypothetical protein
MSPQFILLLTLVGATPESGEVPTDSSVSGEQTTAKLRDQFRDLTRRTARPNDLDPADVVPDLVSLYTALYQPNDLPGSELVDMRRRTETRLEKVRERLLRDKRRLEQEQAREARRNRTQARIRHEQMLAGGTAAELSNAQALIDLITRTIEPDSWAENGGRGTITYFAPVHALVVRNTLHVHEQIGGVLADR